MITAIISMAANIAIAYSLSPMLGINGLALASAGGSTVNALLNYICMRKMYGKILIYSDIVSIFKTLACAAIAALVVFGLYNALKNTLPVSLAGNIIICAVSGFVATAVYAIASVLFGVDEIKTVLNNFKER